MRLLSSLILALPLTLASIADAQELGREWNSISKYRFNIEVIMPHIVNGTERYYQAQTPNYGNILVGSFTGSGLDPAKGLIVLHELEPGYHFLYEQDLKGYVRKTRKGETVNFSSESSTSNSIGYVKYVLYATASVECVGFQQYAGVTGSDTGGGLGTKSILGFYCAPNETSLSPDMAEQVVRSLRWIR